MNLAEAKRAIAAYLVGRPVAADALREACAVARADAGYARGLAEELGLGPAPEGGCEAFLARVAEFGELTPAQRAREMPEQVEHAQACAACRKAYWEVRPLWLSETLASARQQARSLTRGLSEAIGLVIDEAGRLLEKGLGPPSTRPVALAGSTMGPEDEGPREWLLRDEEARCTVRLTVAAGSPTRAAVTCRLEPDPGVSAGAAFLEVYEAGGDVPYHSGPLEDFAAEPFYLPRGAWLIRLLPEGGGAPTWELPLDLEMR